MISDPIEFELFKNALFGVADEMALTVFRTTYSGVLKDNMDYSTALFDGEGVLVAQGLTLPGHLGSMPTAILAASIVMLAFLSFGCGLVLDSVARGRKESKRLAYLAIPGVFADDPRSGTSWR